MELLAGSMRLTGGNECVFCLVLLKQVKKPSSILRGWGMQGVRSAEYAVVFARSLGDCFINWASCFQS